MVRRAELPSADFVRRSISREPKVPWSFLPCSTAIERLFAAAPRCIDVLFGALWMEGTLLALTCPLFRGGNPRCRLEDGEGRSRGAKISVGAQGAIPLSRRGRPFPAGTPCRMRPLSPGWREGNPPPPSPPSAPSAPSPPPPPPPRAAGLFPVWRALNAAP